MQVNTPYRERPSQNTVNLKGTNPQPSVVLNNLGLTFYKNQLLGQDAEQSRISKLQSKK